MAPRTHAHSCNDAELSGHLGVHRMAKMAGAAWKALSEQEQAPFKAQASADKQRHQQESACQAYRLHRLLLFGGHQS